MPRTTSILDICRGKSNISNWQFSHNQQENQALNTKHSTSLFTLLFLASTLSLAAGLPAIAQEPQNKIRNLTPRLERVIWADSWLYAEAPALEVETWLSEKPETRGKYVLVEFWGTFCPPCRRSIPLLNSFHQKFKDELVVIGISHEPVETVKNFKEHKIEYFSAVDTKQRMRNKLNVIGIPHVIIIEPAYGCVVWEGFPLLEGYELTEKTIEKILAVGRKEKAAK